MRKNQENPINKDSLLEKMKLIGGMIIGLLMVNCIWFVVLNQFQEDKSLIKGINHHENLKN